MIHIFVVKYILIKNYVSFFSGTQNISSTNDYSIIERLSDLRGRMFTLLTDCCSNRETNVGERAAILQLLSASLSDAHPFDIIFFWLSIRTPLFREEIHKSSPSG